MDDDYYEDKSREECVAKGFKPGDPIGEVGDNTFDDPNRQAKLALQAAAQAAQAATSADRAAAVYKTGGPTTFFGGAGVGPFAGEMPSSRKAALSRDGVTEENWMHLMSQEVVEANELFAKMRKERLEQFTGGSLPAGTTAAAPPATGTPAPAVPLSLRASAALGTPRGGTPVQGRQPTPIAPPPPPPPEPISTEGLSQAALRALNISSRRQGEAAAAKRQKKVQVPMDSRPKGVYEPHTGMMHCKSF